MMPHNIAKLRMGFLLVLLAATLVFAVVVSWRVYFPPVFHSFSLEEANRGSEVAADDNDPFLIDLLVKYFGCHPLPANSVQHAWYAGFIHHASRFVIHLSPKEFNELKAQIASTVTESPHAHFVNPWFGPGPPEAIWFKWWHPPDKDAFSFAVGGENLPVEIMGNYVFEYDPETQLLYIDATTV